MTGTGYRICARCVLDTTVASIRFDKAGVCNFCESHDILADYYAKIRNELEFNKLLEKIKKSGRGKEYNCIVGVSGGTDSSYALYLAKKSGLRPLAVHFDNGWNTDEAVSNIKALTSSLDVDLSTYVVDWEEFKDLQLSFLKASVPCVETPTDVGIHGALMKTAAREKIKYILGGQSFAAEGTVPREWGYLDGNYINSVHKQFGKARLKTFPNLTLKDIFRYTFINGIRQVPILNYISYSKQEAKNELTGKFGWRDYGGHHYESIYSRFAFGYLLCRKFNIDKRKVSLSGPVRTGLIPRSRALEALLEKPDVPDELVEYCIRKLGLERREFEEIIARPLKTYHNYKTSDNFLRPFKAIVKAAVNRGLFTPVLYEKYCR